MKKIFSLICAFGLACSALCFAETGDGDPEKETLLNQEQQNQLKENGKKALNDMKSAFEKAGSVIEKKAKSISAQACVGKWIFKNGDCTTTIECMEDGSMQVSHSEKLKTELWRGTYTSTSSSIEFKAFIKETRTAFAKESIAEESVWKISYSVADDEKMTLNSENIPADFNGYDFRNQTVFTKK